MNDSPQKGVVSGVPRREAGSATGSTAGTVGKPSPLVRVLDASIWAYQKTLSPMIAAALPSCGCRFAPTCSHYAREALRVHGVIRGIGLATARLARCGPWHPGGIDPVPTRHCTKVSRAARPRTDSLSPAN